MNTKYKHKLDFPCVPNAVVEHYHRLLSGYRYVRNGNITVTKEWSGSDEEAMVRILAAPVMEKTWHDISTIFPGEKEQIILFDAAWRSGIDYDQFRFVTSGKGCRRKNESVLLANKIKNTAQKLSAMLNDMNALGYRSVRNPDLNLNQIAIQEELLWLIEKAGKFNPDKISDEEFVNTAISSQENNSKREYLRGFVCILREAGFPLDAQRLTNIIVDMATSAMGLEGDEVTYDDVYKVLLDFKKLSNL